MPLLETSAVVEIKSGRVKGGGGVLHQIPRHKRAITAILVRFEVGSQREMNFDAAIY